MRRPLDCSTWGSWHCCGQRTSRWRIHSPSSDGCVLIKLHTVHDGHSTSPKGGGPSMPSLRLPFFLSERRVPTGSVVCRGGPQNTVMFRLTVFALRETCLVSFWIRLAVLARSTAALFGTFIAIPQFPSHVSSLARCLPINEEKWWSARRGFQRRVIHVQC
jgi:hypothetical protein